MIAARGGKKINNEEEKVRNLLVGAAVLASIAQTATAATFTAQDLLHGFNNIVLTDLHATAETEGTIFVGGNYSGGATVNPDLEPNVDLGGGVVGTFVVGGDVTGIALSLIHISEPTRP